MAPNDTAIPKARAVRPRQSAPPLTVPLAGGGEYTLADGVPDAFTMLVFFRGLHCPVCQAQLRELERRLDDLAGRGIELVAVSGEDAGRTERIRQEWKLERLTLGYGLVEDQMRTWELFVSRGISDGEPPLFNEPALFLIDPEGSIYYESILSMPVGRPRLDELLDGIDFWVANDYPARGEA